MRHRATATARRRTFVVVEGPPGSSCPAIDRARVGGARFIEGFRLPIGRREAVICTGVVNDAPSAAAALLAAIGGADLIVEARADRATLDRFVDDLRRLGPVDHGTVDEADVSRPDDVSGGEGRAILGLLAEGWSLGEAARTLGLSRRTADRRLAEARRALGAARTAEAIARARTQGWLVNGRARDAGSPKRGD